MTEHKQPEALRLADNLERMVLSTPWDRAAAAELRRLHTVNQQWKEKAATWLASPEAAARLDGYRDLAQQLNDALMQKDALVEALQSISEYWNGDRNDTAMHDACEYAITVAQASLAKAQGEQK